MGRIQPTCRESDGSRGDSDALGNLGDRRITATGPALDFGCDAGATKRYPLRATVSTKTGLLGGIAEGLAELGDGGVQAPLEIHEGVGGPEAVAELFAGDQLAGGLEERLEDAERLILEPDAQPVLTQFTRRRVQLEGSEAAHPINHIPPQVAEEAHLIR